MRKLKFIVDNQIIKPDPKCDFNNLVPGTEDYLCLAFSFSKEWAGYAKVVEFKSMMGKEYKPQVLDSNYVCIVPKEAAVRRSFKIRVLGKNGDSKLATNKITIKQDGGVV